MKVFLSSYLAQMFFVATDSLPAMERLLPWQQANCVMTQPYESNLLFLGKNCFSGLSGKHYYHGNKGIVQ